jgi:hypothetical protein
LRRRLKDSELTLTAHFAPTTVLKACGPMGKGGFLICFGPICIPIQAFYGVLPILYLLWDRVRPTLSEWSAEPPCVWNLGHGSSQPPR